MMELRAEGISRDFLRQSAPQGFFWALREVDFLLAAGTLTAVTGRSGSGKSTLLKILAGLLKPGTGRVLLDGTDIYGLEEAELTRLRSREIGLAPQTLMALSSLSVEENILLPCSLAGEAKEALPHALQLMKLLGIEHLKGAYPDELSGGELRRMTLARALVRKPAILLLDEPTGDLDDESTRLVFTLLRREAEEGRAVLLVTHEREAADYADHLYRMEAGSLGKHR